MKYRKFGKLDWKVSALGFGAMRLPVLNKDQSKIDEPEVIRMMRYAFDHGVNYIDSAYGYHQVTVKLSSVKRWRTATGKKLGLLPSYLAMKFTLPKISTDCLNEQLKRLQTDRIDFYLLHHLNRLSWPKIRDLGILKWADGAIADGRIGYFGFSFHDNF